MKGMKTIRNAMTVSLLAAMLVITPSSIWESEGEK